MKDIVEKVIKQSFDTYEDEKPSCEVNEYIAHRKGFLEGYEWIVTELHFNGVIDNEQLREYMSWINGGMDEFM